MQKIGLFYGTNTGRVEDTAKIIKAKMAEFSIDLNNLSECVDDAINKYDLMIFGIPTWGKSELQDDWEDYMCNLNEYNLLNKTVAIFGLGDQKQYCQNFLDAMGIIYDKVLENGANVVGTWPTDGYDFEDSSALRDGEFVGLVLDEHNQEELSDDRITTWIEQITPYFSK